MQIWTNSTKKCFDTFPKSQKVWEWKFWQPQFSVIGAEGGEEQFAQLHLVEENGNGGRN